MNFPPMPLVKVARGRASHAEVKPKPPSEEKKMSALHYIVPIFLAVEIALVLVALVCAMIFVDPTMSTPSRKPMVRRLAQIITGTGQ